MADAFTGNESKEHASLRMRWASQLNVHFITGVPGGWSKNGQPCDKFHAILRSLHDSFESAALGYFGNVKVREKIDRLLHGARTTGQKKLTHRDI